VGGCGDGGRVCATKSQRLLTWHERWRESFNFLSYQGTNKKPAEAGFKVNADSN
jgi:hypothetical protein